ncbi:MAG: hypothetical protein ACXVH6_01380 [Halobacteriota archaeon]
MTLWDTAPPLDGVDVGEAGATYDPGDDDWGEGLFMQPAIDNDAIIITNTAIASFFIILTHIVS